MANHDKVILIDNADHVIGTMDKLEAHQKGLLHRAVSVFIFNREGEWLLQQRALTKYHSPGLWSNTCCTHPQPDESDRQAANRCLKEEMGLDCALREISPLLYKAEFDNGLTEHEFDHVFVGVTDSLPVINPDEAHNWKYISYDKLQIEIWLNPGKYTAWFKKIYQDVNQEWKS